MSVTDIFNKKPVNQKVTQQLDHNIRAIKKEMFIQVSSSFIGLHYFPNASKIFDQSIEFLEYPHRHIFHVKVRIQVDHNNREKEFFKVKSDLNVILKVYEEEMRNPSAISCEMLCEQIYSDLGETYDFGRSKVEVSVFEDDENGSIIKWG